METPTRRRVLAGLAAGAAIPGAAQAHADHPLSENAGDPVVALGAEAAAARAAAEAATDASCELRQRLKADGSLPVPGVRMGSGGADAFGERQPLYAYSSEEIRAVLPLPWFAKAVERLIAELEAVRAEFDRVHRESGLAELEDRSEAAWCVVDKLELRIRDTAATSAAGVAVKLRVALDHGETDRTTPFEDLDFDDQCVVSALRDLARMATR